MDPEKMLKNLGFGFSPDTDISCGRIPDRFLLGDSSASGIDLYKFVLHHPDLHHLLWMWDKKTEAQSTSGPSNQSTGRKSGQCTSQDNMVTSSNKTESQSASGTGNRKPDHCAREDNMVVDDESGWGILDSENKENVCDNKIANLKHLKQYLETVFASSYVPEVSLDQLESVPDRYLSNIDKISLDDSKNELDSAHVSNPSSDKIIIDQTTVHGPVKTGANDFPEIPGASGGDVKIGTVNGFQGKEVLDPESKTVNVSDFCREVVDRMRQTDRDPDMRKQPLSAPDREDKKPANGSESAGDFKSLGSWSSDSNESLQDVYNVELDENESLV